MDDLPDLIDSCHKSNALPEMINETRQPPTTTTMTSSSSQIFRINNGVGASTSQSSVSAPNASDSEEDNDDEDNIVDLEDGVLDADAEVRRAKDLKDFVGNQKCICLACENQFSTPELAISHMNTKHSFDLVKICLTHDLDQIGYIKLINYLRKNQSKLNQVKESSFDMEQIDDSYMAPHDEEDALLRFGKFFCNEYTYII